MFLCNNPCLQHPWWWSVNQNKSQLSSLQNGHREKLFFNSPFLTISKPLERSEIMFSHQKSVKKAFFYAITPWGVLFCQNKSQLSNLQIDIERSFFNPPFWPFLNHWKGQKSCLLIRRVLKKSFSIWPPLSRFSTVATYVETNYGYRSEALWILVYSDFHLTSDKDREGVQLKIQQFLYVSM